MKHKYFALFEKKFLFHKEKDKIEHTSKRMGFPGGLVVKKLPANEGDIRDAGSMPGLGRSPGGGARQTTAEFLPGESHGQRSLAGYSPWGCRVRHD